MRVRGFTTAMGVILAISLLTAAGASAKSESNASLQVKGSKGYSIFVFGSSSSGDVSLSASGKNGSSASYTAKGKTTSKSIRVKFKGLGKVNVRFNPKGKAETIKPPKGCTGPSTVSQAGKWIGTIRFKGENGYTRVSKKAAKGSVSKKKGKGELECKDPGGGNSKPKQCLSLSTSIRGGSFFAQKIKGKGPTFSAFTSDQKNGVRISRSAFVEGGKLSGDADAQTASLAPPSPFSGTGSVSDGKLSGNLKVKLPGEKLKISGETFVSEGKNCFG